MRYLLMAAILSVGCGGDLTEDAQMAQAVCDTYCEMCSDSRSCAEDCYNTWTIYGGGPKDVCATQFLVGLGCRIEHSCDDPGCGDPQEDMFRCAEDID